ncbi:CHAT domain-containing protein [Oxynema aestuarii]|nr:CHAT domain-containing tetratricopeptide repeat protein [Oxynema aestuarii]
MKRFSTILLTAYSRNRGHSSFGSAGGFRQGAIAVSLCLGLSGLMPIALPVFARPAPPSEAIEETPQAAAQRLFDEGMALFQEGSEASRRRALQKWKQARNLYRQAGDRAKEAYTLTALAFIYQGLGERDRELAAYRDALPIYRQLGDRSGQADILIKMGLVYSRWRDNEKALDAFNEALPLWRELGDTQGEAITLTELGVVYDALGEYQQALDAYDRALSLWRDLGDPQGEATTLNNIGFIYDALGQYDRALEAYNRALPLYQEVEDRAGMARTLNNIGLFYDAAKQYERALDYFDRALPLWDAVGDLSGTATTLNNIGFVYANSEQLEPALEAYQRALGLWTRSGDVKGEASTLSNIGFVYAQMGKADRALDYYNRALPMRRAVGDRAKEALTLYRIASVRRDRGELERAKREIETALQIVEDLRTKVTSQELRASFFASKQDYYEFYIDLLMQMHSQAPGQGFDALALQASERARARSLLDILNEAGADIRQGVDPQLLERERAIETELASLEERRIQLLGGEHSPEQAAQLEEEIDRLVRQYRQVQADIRATSPRYAALTQPQPLNLAQIQAQVLDEESLLLSYSLGKERSFLWAVTSDGIESYELPPRAEIDAAARAFRNALITPSMRIRKQKAAQIAAQLSELVLAPVRDRLEDRRLLIVADGALQYVPFSALPIRANEGASEEVVPLVVEHELVTLPSASAIAVLRREIDGRPPAPKTLAVFADPVFSAKDERLDASSNASNSLKQNSSGLPGPLQFNRLPFTRDEAEKILALVPPSEQTKAFGLAANRDKATSEELSQYQIVHYATHGILDSSNPELSGLVFSLVDERGKPQNGFVRLHDIFNLDLPAQLVVLSACETGLGQNIRGEGLVGLTRGFMYAGAARVVVSLWSVDDEATSLLMVDFYRGMLQEGLSAAAALRQAQIAMWQRQQWEAPYYWAAFTVQGEWH